MRAALPLDNGTTHRLCGRPCVLFLDVDGTLAPIAPRPEYAVVPAETQRLLRRFAALEHTVVVTISGRAAADTRRLVGVDGIWTVGNHGIEIGSPNGAIDAADDAKRFLPALADAVRRCEAIAMRDAGVLVEDKRWTVSVHYRLADPGIVAALVDDVTAVARELGLRLTRGKEVLELRPPIDIDKGTAAVSLAARLRALASGASIFCAGDDRTDEDAFAALRAANPLAVTVHVDSSSYKGQSVAEFRVSGTDEMRRLLEAILALRVTSG